GVKSGVINLGGNIVIIGNRVDGKGFMVGVQEPNSGRNEYLGLVEVSDKAVVSSGTYERFFEQDGKRYHHILNPYTGVPEENSLDGVTVIAEDSTYADALSTTFFLLGLEDGLSLAEGMKEVQAVFITKDKKIYTTSGLRNNFKLEKDTEYVMVK
ncbi:MAG: FAD:protein FMN transferase, partial [Peptostreptococcales bacterium]